MRRPRDGTFRFDPPPLRVGPDLAWVLRRAFAGGGGPPGRPADPESAVRCACALDLAPRIASRIPQARLDEELGAVAAGRLAPERRRAALDALRAERTAVRVATVAARVGIPLLFLKGTALHLSRLSAVTARPVSDVDVLVDPDRAADLRDALLRDGFSPLGTTRSGHHLPPVGRGDDPRVEVHVAIPGCRLPGSVGPVTRPAVEATGAFEALPRLPGRAAVPDRPLMAAHALVHGLDDHGFGPDRYPPMRLLSDLADLRSPPPSAAPARPPADPAGTSPNGAVDSRDRSVLDRIGDAVSFREASAAMTLSACLASGGLPDPSRDPDAARLLFHLAGGALDPGYADALRIRQVWFLARQDPAGLLRRKLVFRFEGLSSTSRLSQASKAVRLLARMIAADLRVRLRRNVPRGT